MQCAAGIVGILLVLSGCSPFDPKPEPAVITTATYATGDYKIGPEDVLEIIVWRNQDLSKTITVRPDGKSFLMVRRSPENIPTRIDLVLNWFTVLTAKMSGK